MVVQGWLNKVKDVEITTKPKGFGLTSCLASVPVLNVLFDEGEIDPFASYYEASRQGRVKGPHHAFGNVRSEEAIAPFFRQFGFPRFAGQELLAGEVLIEAKRLRLLMKAWQAFGARKSSILRQRLGELNFACRFDSHWWYWPPPLLAESSEARAEVQHQREFLGREFERVSESTARYRNGEDLYGALVSATRRICVEPLKQVEFAPEIGMVDGNGIELRWILWPVRFLGETEWEGHGIPHEEPYIGAPYGLMFLLDLNSGIETRVCADPFCRRVFGAARRNQAYCSEHCAHRVAVRNYRQRERAARGHTAARYRGKSGSRC